MPYLSFKCQDVHGGIASDSWELIWPVAGCERVLVFMRQLSVLAGKVWPVISLMTDQLCGHDFHVPVLLAGWHGCAAAVSGLNPPARQIEWMAILKRGE